MTNPSILPLALGIVIFSFVITAILVVPFIDLLYKIKLTRRQEGSHGNRVSLFDKLHDKKAGTPVGGGVLIISIVSILFVILLPVISYLGVFINTSFRLDHEKLIILFTFISFGLLGLLDDAVKTFGKPKAGEFGAVFGLSKRVKFILQIILAAIISFMLYSLLGITFINIPILPEPLYIGPLYIPVATFVIVFFANAFNFTDGLDGLSVGLLMIYLFAYVIIALTALDTPLFVFIALWLGSIIAFLYFNVWPARVWLGDAGALSFGAMIAVIGLLIGNVFALFIIGGIFVIEAFSSLIQILSIKFFKRKVFPLAPIHHTFLAIGWEEPKIVMRAWLVGIMLAIFGVWLATI